MSTNLSDKKDEATEEIIKASAQENTLITRALRKHSKRQTLTPRQKEVLKLVVEGMSSKEIADELKISVKTIDAHRASIMAFLKINDLPALVKYAIISGLTSID